MSKPEIKEVIGGYQFIWTQEQLNISVSRLRVHSSDGRVTGEILLTDPTQDNQAIYPQTSFTFTSDTIRSRLAKVLTDLDQTHQWKDILNQLCLIVIEKARQGEPVYELWTNEEVNAPEFLLEPLLYRGLPTIIFGEKSVCKTTLALAAYTCLTLPWLDNPLGWKTQKDPVITLYADFEVNPKVAHWNIQRLQQGMGLGHFPLFYRRCYIPLADDIDQIQNHMNRIDAKALIVDSLGPAVGGDLNKPEQALGFTLALRQLGCGTLIIGQTSKDKQSKVKSTFGSTFFEYYARNIFELRKVQEEDENNFDIALYNTYHNLGKKYKPQGFHLSFNGTGTHIESSSITAPELIRRLGPQAQILNLLKSGKRTTQEIAEELDMTEANVRVTLSRLKAKTKIVKVEDQFGLLAQQEFISE